MGWVSTVFNIASLSLEAAQLSKLNDLTQQGVASNVIQAVYQELRNQIFNYKQAAEEILDTQSNTPKSTAGAMRLLELRLLNSGITSDIFTSISDKEYVASTHKFIKENSKRLRESLLPADVEEVDRMAQSALRLPQIDYYIEHCEDLDNYETGKEVINRMGFLSNFFVREGIGCLSLVAASVIIGIFAALFGENYAVGIVLGIVVWAVSMIWIGGKVKESKAARNTVKELEEKLDLDLLFALDTEFEQDRNKAIKTKQDFELLVNNFFKDHHLLSI
jgi:hypothetical protein